MATPGNGTRVDLVSAPDDRYLVRLLGEALEYQGLEVTHRAPGEKPKAPIGLGVLTSSGPSAHDWTPLLADYPTSSLIAFANSERATQADAFVLTGWPARSSDGAVRELANRLKIGNAAAGPRAASAGGRSRRRRRGAEPNPVRVLLVLGAVVVLAALLLRGVVENAEPGEAAGAKISPLDYAAARGHSTEGAVNPSNDPGDLPGASKGRPVLPTEGAKTATAKVGVMEHGNLQSLPQTQRSDPDMSFWLSSSVRRFCQAKTLAAAQAWFAVFNWQDKLQASREPCVAQKLASKAFAPVRAQLERQLRSGDSA